jgi:hypothetical protein
MRNQAIPDNIAQRAAEDIIARLPRGWRSKLTLEARRGGRRADALLDIQAPDGTQGVVIVEAKRLLEPKDIPAVLAQLGPFVGKDARVVVAAPYLGFRTRERLREEGVGYADLAGNVWVTLDRPGLLIQAAGAEKNPWREERPARSLKGPKAGRIVRGLCDFRGPIGVRDLAARVGTDPGYVSRVLDLLEREDLVKKEGRGPVLEVDWRGLIGRWAQDYSLLASNRMSSYLDPRGVESFRAGLARTESRYAVTGSLGASVLAPIAPARLAVCFVDSQEALAEDLGLRPAESGANVILAEPFDPVVHERTWEREGITFAAPTQIAADLLTSPGRGPAEAEELLSWMAENEDAWRS